jgi:hypothetical protein
MRAFQKIFTLIVIFTLGACASGGDAIWQTLQNVWGGTIDVSRATLNPQFRYLRLVVDGQVVLLALGYTDAHPQGPIEVWYSAEKEVIRLQNGRVVGASGTTTEWRSVSIPNIPPWSVAAKSSTPIRWIRTRDVMPGYHYGAKDYLVTKVVDPPKRSQLQGIDPHALVWFEEHYESSPNGSVFPIGETLNRLPPAKYAVSIGHSTESVVYAEQCLAPNLCFSWQRWPVPASRDSKK